jgi:hypothetical protein
MHRFGEQIDLDVATSEGRTRPKRIYGRCMLILLVHKEKAGNIVRNIKTRVEAT